LIGETIPALQRRPLRAALSFLSAVSIALTHRKRYRAGSTARVNALHAPQVPVDAPSTSCSEFCHRPQTATCVWIVQESQDAIAPFDGPNGSARRVNAAAAKLFGMTELL
jgi:hypothetical protein